MSTSSFDSQTHIPDGTYQIYASSVYSSTMMQILCSELTDGSSSVQVAGVCPWRLCS